MIKHLTLLLFVFFATNTMAQGELEINLEWGKEMPIQKRTTAQNIIATNNNGIYTLSTRQKGALLLSYQYLIEHYDENFKFKKSVEIKPKYNGKELDLEDVIAVGGKVYVFSSFKNQKKKKNYLFVQTLNLSRMTLNNDLEKVSEISYAGFGKYNSGDYLFTFSSDTSKLLISYQLPYKKKAKEKFGFHVFDDEMNLIWEKDVELPYTDQLFEMQRVKVDYKGDVYVIGRLFKDKNRLATRDGSPNFTYQILSYSENGTQSNEYEARLKDKFITDLQIEIAPNDDIVCAGFYSTQGTYTIKGSFYLSIDAQSKEIKSTGLKKFDMDFLTETMTDREKKKASKRQKKGKTVELWNYVLDEIVMRSDGGVMLVAEQFYTHVVTHHTSNGGTSTTTYYHYDNIIIINISPNGQIEWATTIPKHQVSSNDGGYFSSYVLSVIGSELYFLFNDNPENLDYKKGDVIENTNYTSGFFGDKAGSTLACVVVDAKGEQERIGLLTQKDAGVITRPKVCKQISNDELIIYGVKRKNHRFGRITFK